MMGTIDTLMVVIGYSVCLLAFIVAVAHVMHIVRIKVTVSEEDRDD